METLQKINYEIIRDLLKIQSKKLTEKIQYGTSGFRTK